MACSQVHSLLFGFHNIILPFPYSERIIALTFSAVKYIILINS